MKIPSLQANDRVNYVGTSCGACAEAGRNAATNVAAATARYESMDRGVQSGEYGDYNSFISMCKLFDRGPVCFGRLVKGGRLRRESFEDLYTLGKDKKRKGDPDLAFDQLTIAEKK